MADIDLSDIDEYVSTRGVRARMDRLVDLLDEQHVMKLEAACGLVPGIRQREWTAIAKWLNRLVEDNSWTDDLEGRIDADQVKRWVKRGR